MSKAITRALRMARIRKADGGAAFGTSSPAEDAERPPNVLDKIVTGLGSAAGRAFMAPGRALQSKEPVTSEQLIEPALSMSGLMMGAGSPFAQKGAVGIFGGRLAKTADQAALKRAEEMSASGADRHAIWNETGWFQGPDKKWRFEIPDDTLSVRKGYGAGLEFGAGESWGRYAPKIEHENLTAAYPRDFDYLAHDVQVARGLKPAGRFMPEGPGRNEEFYYSDKPVLPSLFVESPTTKQARSIAAHELQHAVQGKERFAVGANPEALRSEASHLNGGIPKYEDMYDLYHRSAGEVEARNVQKRLSMTPEERRATPPWQTEDIPMSEQIVRAGGGRIRTALRTATGGNVPFAGYIHGDTGGRTDNKPIDVESGSFVIPADILSGLGEGNSHAGWAALSKQFGLNTPTMANGGAVGEPVPIVAAAGEGVIPAPKVAEIGGGDLDRGHAILDALVKHVRKRTIKKLKSLPSPKKN